MNLLSEIDKLPRLSRLQIAAEILKRSSPTPDEIAHAAGCTTSAVYAWMGSRRPFPDNRQRIGVRNVPREGSREKMAGNGQEGREAICV
jgi:hypothetical protein